MGHEAWYAFWTAVGAIVLAVLNMLKERLNTAPKIKNLEEQSELKGHRIAKLETEHEECMEQVKTEWPSDPGFVVQFAQYLRNCGQMVTMQDVARLIRFRKKQTTAPDTEHVKPPEEGSQ